MAGSSRSIVDRSYTEVRRADQSSDVGPETVRLSDLRSEAAYVLLGDPGLGKSTAFTSEQEAQADMSIMIDARDFLVANPGRRQGWRNKTLFIDGLDEVRAGSSDARSALDRIRGQLEALDCPKFRISCREADWLGDNDRYRLEFVSQSSKLRVLRLEPLTDGQIEQILEDHPSVSDPGTFIESARERGVGGLLANPQTLNMLADVVGGGMQWPESRRGTFDQACRVMAREHNQEHEIGGRPPPLDELLQAAGHLCA
ncbi:MAG: hypothetical protein F4Y14_20700, partial [Acidobacteria bacterium]|nr:hypothetical protein [Acidobacteriota bacterium]